MRHKNKYADKAAEAHRLHMEFTPRLPPAPIAVMDSEDAVDDAAFQAAHWWLKPEPWGWVAEGGTPQ